MVCMYAKFALVKDAHGLWLLEYDDAHNGSKTNYKYSLPTITKKLKLLTKSMHEKR